MSSNGASISASSNLTHDQKKRIEENKAKALAKLKEKQGKCATTMAIPTNNNSGKVSFFRQYAYSSAENKNTNYSSQHGRLSLQCSKPNTSSKTSQSNERNTSSNVQSSGANKLKIELVLLNRKRFEINAPFDASLVGLLKTFPNRSYDQVKKAWNFEIKEYHKIVKELKGNGFFMEEIPSSVMKILLQTTHNDTDITTLQDVDDIEPKIMEQLMPFQRDGLNFGIQKGGKLIIADDMGLGKTLQAITIASYYKSDWPVLIVCPSSLRLAWKQAFLNWLPSLNEEDIYVVLSGKDDPIAGLINITSYDLLMKNANKVANAQFNVIIADESHFLKNSKAARTKAALPLLQNARRAILLSGTPALSRPEELFTQILAVNKSLFPSFIPFAKRYCNATKTAFGWDTSGASNLEELKIILESKVMIRRMKQDVVAQLPEKSRQLVTLDPSLINVRKLEIDATRVCNASKRDKHGALLQYFNSTSSAKMKAVCVYLKDLLESGTKFIVFAHHRVMLDSITDVLCKRKTNYIRIDGGTSSVLRQEAVKKFQTDDTCTVAVLSILAAGVGVTLTAATTVIFAELYWNPGALIQAEDRVYRIGQKNAVMIIYLVAKKTADDYIWPLIQEKLKILSTAGLGQNKSFDVKVSMYKDPHQKQLFDYFQEFIDLEGDKLMAEMNSEPVEEVPPKKPKLM